METVLVEQKELDRVVKCVNEGNIVAFPTETVFGLGVKFNDFDALEKIYEVKGREHTKAISMMVSEASEIEKYAFVNDKARKVIKAFMPGMITVILKRKECVSSKYTAGLDTIGIRIPDSEFVLSLLRKTGPMMVTSANLSGKDSLTNSDQVLDVFNGKIPMIVKGASGSTLASTVVLIDDDIHILREGHILKEQIEGVL